MIKIALGVLGLRLTALCLLSLVSVAASSQVDFDAPCGGLLVQGNPMTEEEAATRLATLERQLAELRDPQRRVALYATQRAQVVTRYVDLGQALGLDTRTERLLLAMLASQVLDARQRELELDYKSSTDPQADSSSAVLAAGYTTDRNAIEALVGRDKFWLYVDYERTLAERERIRVLDQMLGPERLSPKQRAALAELLAEEGRRQFTELCAYFLEADRAVHRGESENDLNRRFTLRHLNVCERFLLNAVRRRERLLRQSSQILGRTQQTAFAKIEAQWTEAHRSHVRRMRRAAAIDDAAALSFDATVRPAVGFDMDLELTVNRQPIQMTAGSAVGEPVYFEAPEELLIQASLTETHKLRQLVEIRVYEMDRGQRHFIGHLYAKASAYGPTTSLHWNDQTAVHAILVARRGYYLRLDFGATVRTAE